MFCWTNVAINSVNVALPPYDTWIDASCDKDLDAEFIFLSLDREENSNAGRSDVSDSNAYLQVLDTLASYDLSAG